MDHVKLTAEVLSVEEASCLATHPSCGAISLFLGTTRDSFMGRDVVQLEYEAYVEMAEKEIRSLCTQVREKWPVKHIVVQHRLGVVPVTETSVILAVSSEHRRESLDAVSFLIDKLKARVPIWKKEMYGDGSGDWKKNKECVWVKQETEGTENDSEETHNLNNNKRSDEEVIASENEPPAKKIKEEPVDEDEMSIESTNNGCQSSTMQQATEEEEKVFESKKHDPLGVDPKFIQIVASKQELRRRIEAFQRRKREELDVLNVQEFCTLSGTGSSLNSCARTSAVVLRSKGSSSHLKLTRVVNEWGPQIMTTNPTTFSASLMKLACKQEGGTRSSQEGSLESKFSTIEPPAKVKWKREPKTRGGGEIPTGLEERLGNLEEHLKLEPGSAVPKNVYARIKALEDRVLYLEGISPEYFTCRGIIPSKVPKMAEIKAVENDISVDELDVKIHQLKMKLKQKQMTQVFC